jgi:hypothetical protein
MATLADAAKVTIPHGAAPDSLNQLYVLTDPTHKPTVRTELLITSVNCIALRQDDYVYLPRQGSCGYSVPSFRNWGYTKRDFYNSDVDSEGLIKPDAPAVQLYNVATDLAQTTNLARAEPARAAEMHKRLLQLQQAIEAR